MSRSSLDSRQLPLSLEDGLLLRLATPADVEPLARFNALNLSAADDPRAPLAVAAYTRDLASPTHPTCGPSNFSIVEDTRAGKIVSSMCLIPQTWSYGGIPAGVGRMEIVSTDPEYRRRGLVRMQFELWHDRSAALGHTIQAITGIPWYYRQFGYEYALDLEGGRIGYFRDIPALAAGEPEPFRLRPLTLADVPFAGALYANECARSLVACPRPGWLWTYLIAGCDPASAEYRPYQIIESAAGEAVGYVAPHYEFRERMFRVVEFVIARGQSFRALAPSVLRALKQAAEREAAAQHVPVDAVYLCLGPEHPLLAAIPELLPRTRRAYGWYIRVADVPGFVRHVAPVLEERLARSALAGHTGELKVNEYRSGFRLVFERGRLANVEAWEPVQNEADARIPPLLFLQLLFGFRALAELRAAYPDCVIKEGAIPLIAHLFPRQASTVLALG